MESSMYCFVLFILLVCFELLYFKLAKRYHIVDVPNQRSSHNSIVIRGGGIIFPLTVLIYACFNGFSMPWFVLGTVLLGIISFWDDVHSLPNQYRVLIQIIAIILLCLQTNLLHIQLWWLIIVTIFIGVGFLNMFNFLDGINGMLGGYSTIVLLSLLTINQRIHYVHDLLILSLLLADVIFCFFNFRPKGKAKCFCGDVGAICMAFACLFLISTLITYTQDPTWFILVVVFGIDAGLTILHRILLHEHLGQAHRKHAYQIMVNELHLDHTLVSCLYVAIQAAISFAFICIVPNTQQAHWIFLGIVIFLLSSAYFIFIKRYYYLHQQYLDNLNK